MANFLTRIFGSRNQRLLREYSRVVSKINALEEGMQSLNDEELRAKTEEFKSRVSGDRYGYGIMVEVNHGNGYSTRYAHNSENLVEVGDEVRKGQAVALMGETGRATGPNLHFEVLRNGARVNPVNFIRDSSK